MRCRNCGWENSPNSSRCEKCSTPLNGASHEEPSGYSPERRNYEPVSENLRGTVQEAGSDVRPAPDNAGAVSEGIVQCRECGYPVGAGMNVCPNCGTALHQGAGRKRQEEPHASCRDCGRPVPAGSKFCPHCGSAVAAPERPAKMGTVNAWDTPVQGNFCTLRPINWKGEEAAHTPISYSGDTIILNRANTDPNNNTITSKEQAVLIHDGSNWYIEDRSEMHTTLLRVSKRMKLEDGDIIVLGNRLFEFKG